MESQEEEKIDLPTTSGRTSWDFDRYYRMQRISLELLGTRKGSVDNQIDTKPWLLKLENPLVFRRSFNIKYG